MAKVIGLPKLSPTMEEGTLVRWVKQEGDAIEVDDLVAEVETDKATMEFRSFDKGVLLKQLAPEGSTLAPDQPVAIFGKAGEDISALLKEAGGKGAPTGKSADAPAQEKAKTPKAKAPEAKAGAKNGQGEAKTRSKTPAEETDEAEEQGEVEEQDETEPAEVEADEADAEPDEDTAQPTGASSGGRVFASPVVRKIARERDIDLSRVRGSGPGGRVIKRDVESEAGEARVGLPGAAIRGPSVAPSPRSASRGPTGADKPTATPTFATGQDRTEKLSQMRKTIARRLTESKQTVPHFYLTIDIDAEPLVDVRAQINADLASSGEKISLNDLLIKACALALRRMPKVNASFLGDAIVYHGRVDISVAVAIPDGLLTPVVRNADQLGVLAIAQTVRDLAGRAKDKKLKPEEMQNGTFSISNLGMFGIDEFSAVINPPEGAILAVSAVRDVPVVKNGAVVPGKRMALTMSCDHRVIDGALGAEWLKLLRSMLESPLRMLL